MRLMKESARVDGGGQPGNPSRRPVQEVTSGDALEVSDCGNTGLHQIAKTGLVLWTLFDV
jgi:hypothetical protein